MLLVGPYYMCKLRGGTVRFEVLRAELLRMWYCLASWGVPYILEGCQACIFKGPAVQEECHSSWTAWRWRGRHYDPLEVSATTDPRNIITSQKTWTILDKSDWNYYWGMFLWLFMCHHYYIMKYALCNWSYWMQRLQS